MTRTGGKRPKRTPLREAPGSAEANENPNIPPAEEQPFPIVGVGASAGGLEAFTKLLEHLPATTGMAFVLIQHLDPHHASQFPDILSRKSKMPVREVQGNIQVKANHVYVIPANADLRLEEGVLHAVPR